MRKSLTKVHTSKIAALLPRPVQSYHVFRACLLRAYSVSNEIYELRNGIHCRSCGALTTCGIFTTHLLRDGDCTKTLQCFYHIHRNCISWSGFWKFHFLLPKLPKALAEIYRNLRQHLSGQLQSPHQKGHRGMMQSLTPSQ